MTQELQVPNGNSKLSGLYQRGNIEGVGRYAGFPKMQAAVSSSNQWLWEGGHAAGFQMRDPSIGRRMDELNARGSPFTLPALCWPRMTKAEPMTDASP